MFCIRAGARKDEEAQMPMPTAHRTRKLSTYLTIITRAVYLTNWRAQQVYSPHVIRELLCGSRGVAESARWSSLATAQAQAERLAAQMRAWAKRSNT